jgi:NAD(P)-dependent dehydrogenase (short-subunit alcohol dehydrogenase family)
LGLTKYLVFGSSGALGKTIVSRLRDQGSYVVETTRTSSEPGKINTDDLEWPTAAKTLGEFDGIVWAQGINLSDTILSAAIPSTLLAVETNVIYIMDTLQKLVNSKALSNPCRTVVLSSIWQESSRSSKFSYSVSKAAIHGLVQSAAIDLADSGIAINAVLPGIIDTPMTRANLTLDQIKEVEQRSLGGTLATAENVAETVAWLLSDRSAGVNGSSIKVDQGWSINSGL